MADEAMSPRTPERPIRSTAVRVSLPFHAKPAASAEPGSRSTAAMMTDTVTTHPVRKLVRRDSLERREALLKGKEGSRQRRRWENGT